MRYIYPVDSMTATLKRAYERSSLLAQVAGKSWYPEARHIMREWSDEYGYSVDTCACVTAALSPQIEWTRNLIIADDILAGRVPSIGGALPVNVVKAERLRDMRASCSDMLSIFPKGPKVNCFAANLAGDDSIVTVDGHAAQAALDDVQFSKPLGWKPYGDFAAAYVQAARDLGLSPSAFQAIIWLSWRERWPRLSKRAARRQS